VPSAPAGHPAERSTVRLRAELYYWALSPRSLFVVGGAVRSGMAITALVHPPRLEAFWAA